MIIIAAFIPPFGIAYEGVELMAGNLGDNMVLESTF